MQFLANRNTGSLSTKRPLRASRAYQVQAQCFPLYSILLALNRTCVDVFSLDVEGAELPVLKTIPFEHVTIKLILVEFIHGDNSKLTKFLESQGFMQVTTVHNQDFIFVNKLFYNPASK